MPKSERRVTIIILETDEQILVDQLKQLEPNITYKECKVCKKKLPVHFIFFMKEKRIHDGFENSCRVCRNGKYKNIDYAKMERPNSHKDIISAYEYYLKTNCKPTRTFIKDHYKEIIKYLIEVKYNMTDEQITRLNRDWIQEHKLYGLSILSFQGSIYKIIDEVYPNRFKPWDFVTVGNYWHDEQNVKKTLLWFVDQLIIDNVISCIDEIPEKVNGTTFKEYGIGGLLNTKFGHAFNAFEYLYPNRFFEWEYNPIPTGFMTEKENRIKAMKQLIEQRLRMTIEEIPLILSFEYFRHIKRYSKFTHVINDYYNFDLYSYIDKCYPNTFKREDLPYQNHYETLDGIMVRSEPERMLHHIFRRNGLDIEYEPYTYRFYNKSENETYRPDWAIKYNGKIILVEYYGMLNMNDIDFGYKDKHKRKEQYYKELCAENEQYIYIGIVPEDIRKSRYGLIRKFNNIGIELDIGTLYL